MITQFLRDESGAMSIEAAIITAAFVALAIIFRKQLAKLWGKASEAMSEMEENMGE